jgi:hypothetical protein
MMPLSARKFLSTFFSFASDNFACLCFLYFSLMYSGDEEENPPVDVTARTSVSRTLVISETHPEADETSPPQQDIGHPSPVVSPRAPSPKRAKTNQGKELSLLIDRSTAPLMDDVSASYFLFTVEYFQLLCCRNSSTSLLSKLFNLFLFHVTFPAFDEGIRLSRYPIYRVL